MRRKYIAFVFLVLTLSLITVALGTASELHVPYDSVELHIDGTIRGAYFFENQDSSTLIHQEMLNSFGESRSGDVLYPSYYAGTFINGEGNLTISIVEGYKNTSLHQLAGVSIRYVDYSYNELLEMMDFISEIVFSRLNCEISKNVIYTSIDVVSNRIVVGLYGYSDDLVSSFKHYILDNPMVTFEGTLPLAHKRGLHADESDVTNTLNSHYIDIEPVNSSVIVPGQRIYII